MKLLFIIAITCSIRKSLSYPITETRSNILRLLDDPSFQSFQLRNRSVYCGINVVSNEFVKCVLEDVTLLQTCGFGTIAKVVLHDDSLNVRRQVHQTWIRSKGSTNALNTFVGNIEARSSLIGFIESLKSVLENDLRGLLPSHLVELSYLSYQPGSFYKKHLDVILNQGTSSTSERSISFLLYLGDPTDDTEWNCAVDGGALRIFDKNHARWTEGFVIGDDSVDIQPKPGTLLLFDSKSVLHEVLSTHRSRVCVVGWFGALC